MDFGPPETCHVVFCDSASGHLKVLGVPADRMAVFPIARHPPYVGLQDIERWAAAIAWRHFSSAQPDEYPVARAAGDLLKRTRADVALLRTGPLRLWARAGAKDQLALAWFAALCQEMDVGTDRALLSDLRSDSIPEDLPFSELLPARVRDAELAWNPVPVGDHARLWAAVLDHSGSSLAAVMEEAPASVARAAETYSIEFFPDSVTLLTGAERALLEPLIAGAKTFGELMTTVLQRPGVVLGTFGYVDLIRSLRYGTDPLIEADGPDFSFRTRGSLDQPVRLTTEGRMALGGGSRSLGNRPVGLGDELYARPSTPKFKRGFGVLPSSPVQAIEGP